MRRKVLIIAVILWIICACGGGLYEPIQRYFNSSGMSDGEIRVRHLKELYNAKQFDEAIRDCEESGHAQKYSDCRPQIMYIQWAANQQIGRTEKAGALQRDFLAHFPNHMLAADFYLNDAIVRLTLADYSGADRKLKIICEQFPSTAVAKKAREIRERLAGVQKLKINSNDESK